MTDRLGNLGLDPNALQLQVSKALFNYLWNADSSLVVVGGRGASSAVDWAAPKKLTLPDWRGYALGALDDMGNTASGRISVAFWGGNPILLGAAGGAQSTVLTAAHIPAAGLSVTVSGTTSPDSPDHAHNYTMPTYSNVQNGGGASASTGTASVATSGATARHTHTFGATGALAGGGGQGHRTIGPRKLITFYMKL